MPLTVRQQTRFREFTAYNPFAVTTPANVICENVDRALVNTNTSVLVSGRLSLMQMLVPSGSIIGSIGVLSGTQAAVTPANQWFCLVRPSDRALLAITADDTSTAWAANTMKTLALASPYNVGGGVGGVVGLYVGVCVVAATVPSFTGVSAGTNVAFPIPTPITVNSSAGLTDPASCPDPVGAFTTGSGQGYCVVTT